MLKVYNLFLHFKNSTSVCFNAPNRFTHSFNFDSDEGIVTNVVEQLMTIGINLPDSKNKLTENALMQLNDTIKNVDEDSRINAAVLHGIGGNLCTGIVLSDRALELSQNLLNTLNTMKKPLVASLEGYTTDFGLKLAIMCDIRIMDSIALTGFSRDLAQESPLQSFIYKRLILNIGLSRTMELICTRRLWLAKDCLNAGLVNNITQPGSAFGVAITHARSISFNNPLEKTIESKAKILSFLNMEM